MDNVKNVTINGETHAIGVEWDNVDNKPQFSDVATSGSYNDLIGRPDLYVLPEATSSTLGGVKVSASNGMYLDDGTVGVNLASSNSNGTITNDLYTVLKVLQKINISSFDADKNVITISGKMYELTPYTQTGLGTAYIGWSKLKPTSVDEAQVVVDLNTESSKYVEISSDDLAKYAWILVPTGNDRPKVSMDFFGDITEDFEPDSEIQIEGYDAYSVSNKAAIEAQYTITF